MLRRVLIAGLTGVLGPAGALAAPSATVETPFVDRAVTVAGEQHRYKVFVPANHELSRRWPVILFLHGAGERGTDNVAQTRVGLGPALQRDAARYPAIVVFPQVARGARWSGPAAAIALAALAQTEREFHTDPDRVYLTGISMGGSGAWYIAYRNPDRFAALLVVCARLIPTGEAVEALVHSEENDVYATLAERLKDVPIWLFHGDEDDVVPIEESRQVSNALRTIGAPVRYSELAGVGHDAWDAAYGSREVVEWLFRQRSTRAHPRLMRNGLRTSFTPATSSAISSTRYLVHYGCRHRRADVEERSRSHRPRIPSSPTRGRRG